MLKSRTRTILQGPLTPCISLDIPAHSRMQAERETWKWSVRSHQSTTRTCNESLSQPPTSSVAGVSLCWRTAILRRADCMDFLPCESYRRFVTARVDLLKRHATNSQIMERLRSGMNNPSGWDFGSFNLRGEACLPTHLRNSAWVTGEAYTHRQGDKYVGVQPGRQLAVSANKQDRTPQLPPDILILHVVSILDLSPHAGLPSDLEAGCFGGLFNAESLLTDTL